MLLAFFAQEYAVDLHSVGTACLTLATVRGENVDSLKTRVFIAAVPSFHWAPFVVRLVRNKAKVNFIHASNHTVHYKKHACSSD
jgi:hypothetical protein